MILPRWIHPSPDYGVTLTEQGQAISLKTIAYRVSCGHTTGLASSPQSYGDDDEYDDADLNGIENDYIDVESQRIDQEYMQDELKNRLTTPARPERKDSGNRGGAPIAASTSLRENVPDGSNEVAP